MMWLRCCCYCCCCTDAEEEKDSNTLDDSSSLIVQHPFYVPRRHSSFQPSTSNPTFVESGRIHSDGSSSSDDERVPESRGRCWSTIPASDVTAFVASQRNHNNPRIQEIKVNLDRSEHLVQSIGSGLITYHRIKYIEFQVKDTTNACPPTEDKHSPRIQEIKVNLDRSEHLVQSIGSGLITYHRIKYIEFQVKDTTNACPPTEDKHRIDSDLSSGKVQFDKHFLSEIAELEQDEQETNHHPSRTDDSEVYGHIIFTTMYDEQEQRLKVFLKQATGLPKKGEHPYGTFVKTSLTSGKNVRMTRPSKKISDPVYEEEHVFPINRSKWKSTSYLKLSVFDCDRQGRHDAIGHALLSLEEIGQNVQEHCLSLTPMSLPVKNLGQILIGLLYSPTQSRLAIHVIKARHLRLDDEAHKRHLRPLHKDVLDSFCKVTLTCGGQKVKTCRSRPATGFDPFFDFRTSFVVPPQYLRDAGIIVSVVARSTLGREGATLGRAPVLGPYVEKNDGSVTQWGKMIQEGRSTVQWRNLYL